MGEWVSSVRLRLQALLRRRQLERDLDDELAFHLSMREEQLRTGGVTDAHTIARRRFGSAAKIREELRDVWALAPSVGGLVRDFRYAARALRRNPVFAAVVIFTLGLGIGANTAFFTVVNAALFRPLGYADADRLVSLHEGFPRAGVDKIEFSPLDYEDLQRDQQSFDSVAAYRNIPFEMSGRGAPQQIAGTKISAGLFQTLGVAPAIGRTFSAAEDRPGANVAILSWGLWQRRLGGDPAILGQSVVLDRQSYTIVGIMPEGFVFPVRGALFNAEPADVWVPIAFTERDRLERGTMHSNSVVARLRRGVSLQIAQAELDVLSVRIGTRYPAVVQEAGFTPRLVANPLREDIAGRFEKPLLMLLAAVGLVLLVVCANVANLILSRVVSREGEFTVRTALGARRSQLVHLLLCEALLLAAAGGVVGVALATLAVNAAPAVLARTLPGFHDVAMDWRVLAFTAAICLGTAIVFAALPIAALARSNAAASLSHAPSRTTMGASRLHLQRAFVVGTMSLACVLLVGAGLFIRSFTALLATDLGFQASHVLTMSLTLPRTFYTTGSSVRSFHDSLLRTLSPLPGVRSVALATDLPLTTYEIRAFTLDRPSADLKAQRTTSLTWVHGPYFETLGMSLTRGRFFTLDEYTQARAVVIVNEKLARLAWPGQDPIGRRVKWGNAAGASPWLTVVGVIGDVVDGPIGEEWGVHAYEPFRQLPDFFLDGAVNQFGRELEVALLTDGEPRALIGLVRQEIAKLDPDLAIERIQPMEEQIREVVAPRRFSTMLVGAFAGIALLLASVGLYGLVAYTMAQRRREIAVRIALGAERHALMWMVIAEGVRLVAAGVVLGVGGALLLTGVVTSLLYHTNPFDPITFASVPAVLAIAALVACALPAWRATRVDPTIALRAE